jgi:hypothetical protein
MVHARPAFRKARPILLGASRSVSDMGSPGIRRLRGVDCDNLGALTNWKWIGKNPL